MITKRNYTTCMYTLYHDYKKETFLAPTCTLHVQSVILNQPVQSENSYKTKHSSENWTSDPPTAKRLPDIFVPNVLYDLSCKVSLVVIESIEVISKTYDWAQSTASHATLMKVVLSWKLKQSTTRWLGASKGSTGIYECNTHKKEKIDASTTNTWHNVYEQTFTYYLYTYTCTLHTFSYTCMLLHVHPMNIVVKNMVKVLPS